LVQEYPNYNDNKFQEKAIDIEKNRKKKDILIFSKSDCYITFHILLVIFISKLVFHLDSLNSNQSVIFITRIYFKFIK
jgi:hypothetical protein